jgi:uncharacterized protein YjeT (DUF2065 family)/Zn finger protein HypA/HybF involved in hydrogenase expression
MPSLVTCPCQHCNGHIQFDPATLSPDNNKTTCPHCSMETILFVPPPRPTSPPKPKTATLFRIEAEWNRNLEENLDNAAETVRLIGIIGVVIGIIVAVLFGSNSGSPNAPYFAWTIVIGSITSLVINYSISLVFNAAAEMIRLLKKQAGVPFSGQFIFQCSECKGTMNDGLKICPGCGAKFISFSR